MYDAIIILGGGINENQLPHEWVQRRIKKAIELTENTQFFIATSFVSPHKPAQLDEFGLVISESFLIGKEMIKKEIPKDKILYENYSVDTLGNIFFTRFLHTDIRKLSKIAIITSEFHMPRTKILADWIFNLPPNQIQYQIDYISVSDEGIDQKIIDARIKKENVRISQMKKLSDKITTVESLHEWLYTEHSGYTLYLKDELIADRADESVQKSY